MACINEIMKCICVIKKMAGGNKLNLNYDSI